MGDKETFPQRIEALRLIPEAIEEVRVHVPLLEQGIKKEIGMHVIPNAPGKQGSLQVYAAITTNDGYIDAEGARRGLEVFGKELRDDAVRHPGKHPNIDLLEVIAESRDKLRCDVVRRNSEALLPERIAKVIPQAVKEFGTPFIILDGDGIRQTLRGMKSAFSWNPGFKEFFAVKAFPNPYVLELCRQEGAGADCSSSNELDKAEAAGIVLENKILTANNVPVDLFRKARSLGSLVNFDDITDIEFFERYVGKLPEVVSVRFNPGNERVSGGHVFGKPEEQKYGMTREQVFQAIRMLKQKGVKRFSLHTMFASNCLDQDYHIGNAEMLFNLVGEIKSREGADIDSVNTGGGWGLGYQPEQRQLSPEEVSKGVKEAYDRIIVANGLKPVNIFMENGRFVTGPHGWLVARVRHQKHTYREYVGVDASSADFARPAAYGAYHHAIILGKEHAPHTCVYDVVGPLCENCDKFAVNRLLPETEIGDLFILCGAGAHGRAMGSNYNDQLRCKAVMVEGMKVEMIMRGETARDLNATLDFPGSRFDFLAKR